MTAKTLHWRLICGAWASVGGENEGHSCRAEPFIYGFWCYLQVDGVRIELNYNTSSCCWTIWRYIVWKKNKTTLHLSEFGTRLLRTQLLWKLESCWEFSQGLATYWVSPATLQIAVQLCLSDTMTNPYWAVQSYFIMLEFECWNEVFKRWKQNEATPGLDPYSSPILVRSCENLFEWDHVCSF